MDNIKDILTKYDKSGPRYTSYPPATHFTDSYTSENYKKSLIESNSTDPKNISIYIHIPFCKDRCFFCGCNAFAKKTDDFETRYVDAILTEIENVGALVDCDRIVTQIHWGGGTPNSIDFDLIEKIFLKINDIFSIAEDCEIAMECNPADLNEDKIKRLAEFGINRVSLGIQDLREDVLEVVNRRPPTYPVDELVQKLKAAGIKEVNIDLIYGLPLQTVESFNKTIDEIIKISPDRLVTFSYAHVPWVMKAQTHLEKIGLPTPEEKMTMLISSHSKLTSTSYEAIGMDHYAKAGDPLEVALKNKQLHRNFQGYCTTQTTGQVYAFGCSGISQLTHAYIQNVKTPQQYIDKIEETGFATARGYELSKDERICRTVINEVMCNLYLDFDAVAEEFGVSAEYVKGLTEFSEEKLHSFINDGLLSIDGNIITISKEGAFIVRNIAMCFDPKLKHDRSQYSRTV